MQWSVPLTRGTPAAYAPAAPRVAVRSLLSLAHERMIKTFTLPWLSAILTGIIWHTVTDPGRSHHNPLESAFVLAIYLVPASGILFVAGIVLGIVCEMVPLLIRSALNRVALATGFAFTAIASSIMLIAGRDAMTRALLQSLPSLVAFTIVASITLGQQSRQQGHGP